VLNSTLSTQSFSLSLEYPLLKHLAVSSLQASINHRIEAIKMIIELSILGLCVIILLTIFFTLLYLGYFSNVEVKAGSSPIPFANKTFVYKSFKDNYSGIGYQFTVLHNLTACQPDDLRKKLSDAVAVGIYYDEPNAVKDECRFTVGLLLVGQSDCEQVKELFKEQNYEFTTFPDVDNVVSATFPFKGSVSIPIAIRAVYPRLNEFIKEKKLFAYPSMEFYEKDIIHFILPLDKQKEFVFTQNQAELESSDEDVSESEKKSSSDDKSPRSQRSKDLKRSDSGSSFDELNLEEESDKNV